MIRNCQPAAFFFSLLIILTLVIYWQLVANHPSVHELLKQAEIQLELANYDEAERLAQQAVARESNSTGLFLAAKAADRAGRSSQAAGYIEQLSDDGSEDYVAASLFGGQLFLRLGFASKAEKCFRSVIQHDPANLKAHEELALLYTLEGRRWESVPHLFQLLRHQMFSPEQLIFLGDLHLDYTWDEEIQRLQQASPDDKVPLIGPARAASHRNEFEKAERLLRTVVSSEPNMVEAWVLLGSVLLEKPNAFSNWWADAPKAIAEHPDYWVALGQWAISQKLAREAIRCYWQAVRLDPNNQTANYQLASLLHSQDENEKAAAFEKRAILLQHYVDALQKIFESRRNPLLLARRADVVRELAETAHSLGRLWEAGAWYQILTSIDPQSTTASNQVQLLSQQLAKNPPRVLESANPAIRIDLSSYPLPEIPSASSSGSQSSDIPTNKLQVQFDDVAQSVGITFRYFNGHKPPLSGLTIVEAMGGGAGVLDVDLDGWPDLYLTQGSSRTKEIGNEEHADRLYRNLGDGSFIDVTSEAGLGDQRFSQGVAIGDYDSDGFPDIYLANVGLNRLYRNNGDATFTDVSEDAGIRDSCWTTSCVVADLNGDGLPDIYDVNYVKQKTAGPGLDQLCQVQPGKFRVCGVKEYAPEQDKLYLNRGDGGFEDVTESAGVVSQNGFGLGIVVCRNTGSGLLNIFVANDESANLWFVNKTSQRGEALSFVERGVICGLAANANGISQGCMGVAAGDANNDGALDLFVTNFYNESNTLYEQQSEIFADATAQARLVNPSHKMLGFGTQFIDADLDGWEDLLVANGHLDKYDFMDIPFKMPTQFFQNVGHGRFVEQRSDSLGPFFKKSHVGRGMARWDWNRDGLEDVVISHLDEPLALLTNQTEKAGHYLAVQLRGVNCDRDAIGSMIRLKIGNRTMVKQLTAGDGYMASNERQLVFGLAEEDRIDELEIHWPHGLTNSYSDLSVGRQLLFVEGVDAPVVVPTE